MDLPWISVASAVGKRASRRRPASNPRSVPVTVLVSVLEMLLHERNRTLECIICGERPEILREAVIGVGIRHKLDGAAEGLSNVIELSAELDALTPVRFTVHDQERREALGDKAGHA